MTGRTTTSRRARHGREEVDLAPEDPGAIRNVALVGPSAAGKTTLVEELLATTGAISRAGSVTAGTTVCDHDAAAKRQQRSVSLSVAPLRHRDVKINVIDTPGCADFLCEVRAGLRAADAVLFVVGAADLTDGLDAQSAALWEECVRTDLPRVVVLSRLDHARADLPAALAAVRDGLSVPGTVLAPLSHVEPGPDGAVGALLGPDTPGSGGRRGRRRPARARRDRHRAERGRVPAREPGSPASPSPSPPCARISPAPSRAARWSPSSRCAPPSTRGSTRCSTSSSTPSRHPPRTHRCPRTARTARGTRRWLPIRTGRWWPRSCTPAPIPRPAGSRCCGCSPDGCSPTASSPWPTTRRGPRPPPTTAPSDRRTARVARVYSPLGATLREVPAAVAGDLCALTRLSCVVTGDTLCGVDDPVGIDGWEIPEPLLPVAVTAADRTAQDAMARGLARLVGTEVTLRVDRNEETHQIVLWCTGEAHADVVLDRLRATGATVEVTEVAVPARETVAGPARGLGRHVKQSGGHGQYAVCAVEIEPLPGGSGVEFVDRIVGGAIPRAYIPGVEKGVRAQLATGVTPERPVVDVRVTLVDGKAHSVDSSDQAFQTAGALAVREAVTAAGTVLLEPVHEIEVTVDDDQLGAVLGDLAARHGRVVATEPDLEHGRHTRVRAEVPEAALRRYAVDLRALSGGAARFTRRFSRYESVPASP